jgi:hypothetical protein
VTIVLCQELSSFAAIHTRYDQLLWRGCERSRLLCRSRSLQHQKTPGQLRAKTVATNLELLPAPAPLPLPLPLLLPPSEAGGATAEKPTPRGASVGDGDRDLSQYE